MILGIAAIESGWLYLVTSGVLFLLANHLSLQVERGGWFWSSFPPVASCALAYYLTNLYDIRVARDFRRFCSSLPRAVALVCLLLAAYYLVSPTVRLFPGLLASTLAALGVVILLSIPLRWMIAAVLQNPGFSERVLIVGSNPLALRVAAKMSEDQRFDLVGLIDDRENSETLAMFAAPNAPCRRVGSLERLRAAVAELRPNRIIVGLAERRNQMPIRDLLEYRAAGVAIEDAVEAYERVTEKLAIESLTPSSLIFNDELGRSRAFGWLERALSVIVAIVGLTITAPLMALVAIAIKIDSAGPVFFVQARAGLRGKRFDLYKFRTMHAATVDGATSYWAADNYDRITRIGAWLRRMRIDELPQFVNILRGDMNLIGPRPHPVANAALFREQIPYYPLRELVRPGLTGWAQTRVGYANGLVQETEKMRYDLYYIKNRSLAMNARILRETVRTVFSAEGS